MCVINFIITGRRYTTPPRGSNSDTLVPQFGLLVPFETSSGPVKTWTSQEGKSSHMVLGSIPRGSETHGPRIMVRHDRTDGIYFLFLKVLHQTRTCQERTMVEAPLTSSCRPSSTVDGGGGPSHPSTYTNSDDSDGWGFDSRITIRSDDGLGVWWLWSEVSVHG